MIAVKASLAEWQTHIASSPKINGKIAIIIGGQITLRDRDTVSALLVRSFACQYEIIKILNPARKKPEK